MSGAKDKKVSIRIDSHLEQKMEAEASKRGLSLSAYGRMLWLKCFDGFGSADDTADEDAPKRQRKHLRLLL